MPLKLDLVSVSYSKHQVVMTCLLDMKILNFIRKVQFSDDGYITLSVYDATHNIPVLLKYASNVESVEYSIPTLNDVFLQLTGRHIAKEDHSEGGFMERYAQY